jgi:hypothetical protein
MSVGLDRRLARLEASLPPVDVFARLGREWLADWDDKAADVGAIYAELCQARDQGETLDVVDTQLLDGLERFAVDGDVVAGVQAMMEEFAVGPPVTGWAAGLM